MTGTYWTHAMPQAVPSRCMMIEDNHYMSFDSAAANRALVAVISRQRLSYARYVQYVLQVKFRGFQQ